MGLVHILSMSSRGLKFKVTIVFALISIIPVLVFLNYILPSQIPIIMPEGIPRTKLIFVVVFFIILLGFFMLKDIIDSVLSLSSQAKLIAHGDYSKLVTVRREDEIGDLSVALNQLTTRIKSTMQEMRQYSEKTKDINLDIHKRVSILSGLLQITELISKGEQIGPILDLTLDKLTQVASSDFSCYLSFQGKLGQLKLESTSGFLKGKFTERELNVNQKLLRGLFEHKATIIIDTQSPTSKDIDELRDMFTTKNILLVPVVSRVKIIGILVLGNNLDTFTYKSEDLETADIFAKQISVCIENDELQQKVKSLEIKDALTGLYNREFIEKRLGNEIKKAIAYQKPCSLVILSIDNFQAYHSKFGALASEAVLKQIAAFLESIVGEIDLVGRMGDNEFAIILPARSKRQAMSLFEEIKNNVQTQFLKEKDEAKRIILSGGVSENPLDGSEGDSLIAAAKKVLNKTV